MRIQIATLILCIVFSTLISCKDQDAIIVEAYSSFNNAKLPSSFKASDLPTNYDSIINYAARVIGLPDTDIEIEETSTFGAFSVINRLSHRRFFVYSPIFFDSVFTVTKSNYGILSICFHELAHHHYRHPLKPSYASHIYEKQADRYSGFQLAIMGATLEQTLAVMNNIELFGGTIDETLSHPDKLSRLAEIEKGYIDARILIFEDTSYIRRDSVFKMKEMMYALSDNKSFIEIQNKTISEDTIALYSNKVYNKYEAEDIYNLYGDLIYLKSDMKIKLLSNEQTIGHIIQPNPELQSKILSLDGIKFYLEGDKIYSINPDGFKLEIGNKITH